MGQKVNPIGLRLGIVHKAKSEWFANPRTGQYSFFVQQDRLVREFLMKELQDAGLSKVLISRRPDRFILEIFVAQPKVVLAENGSRLKSVTQKIQKILERETQTNFAQRSDREYALTKVLLKRKTDGNVEDSPSKYEGSPSPVISIQVIQIPQEEIAIDAVLLGQRVAEQLEKRVAFRRVMKQSVQQARAAGAQGIKMKISGRLNGAEIARSETIKDGRIPLQTLRANVEYCSQTAQTIYGILGIKIWILKTSARTLKTGVGA